MKLLLLLTAVVLSGLLYLQLEVWPRTLPVRSPPAHQPVSQNPPVGTGDTAFSVPLGDAGDYRVIAERTLFRPERRPAEDEVVEVQVSSAAESLEGVDLRTVLITPTLAIAWVREKGGKEDIALKSGESLRGWKVRRIERNALVLEHGEEKATIDLREFPEQARTPPPGAKPDKKQTPQQAARKQRERPRPPSRGPGREG